MIYKSYILEQNISNINKYKIFLFYGVNQGLKKDLKENLKKENKNFETLNFFQEEIIKNKDTLIKEVTNKSLFDKEKVFFIDEVNDKILETIEEAIEHLNGEKIYLFSDILDKKSKLRSYFEKSKVCGITACYQDNEITIRNKITEELSSLEGFNNEILRIIIQTVGLDRNKINNELQKIKNCFVNKKIDSEQINLLLNIKTNDDFNFLKDEAINGNKQNTNRLLAETIFLQENIVYYLNLINQRVNKLSEIQNLKEKNPNIETAIMSLKPPVFWKDKPILIDQSKKWNKKKIQLALNKTYNAELEIKSNSLVRKDLIIKNLLIDLCLAANAS